MRAPASSSGTTAIADRTKGFSNTSGPIVINGKVVQGLQGCDDATVRNAASSAPTTRTPASWLWKFHTIARSGEPGGDTWNKLPDIMRAGGETWIVGSYDPDLDLTYWGIAQAKPWMHGQPRHQGHRCGALCLVDGGAARCRRVARVAFQHVPGESLDLDEVFERVLVDIGAEKVVFNIGKAGILWKLDRRTGKFLAHKETVFQNVYDTINPTTGVDDVSRRHPRAGDRRMDSSRVRVPKAVTTGRR